MIDGVSIEMRDGVFSFNYSSPEKPSSDVSDIRIEICRFIDEAIDSLLRLNNRFEVWERQPMKREYYIELQAGDSIDE